VQEITAVIGLADPASPCRARGADPALVAGGPECRRRLRPNSPRPVGPGGLRRPGAADRLTTPQCLTGGGGTSLPAEGRLEHDHSVLDGITTAEAQSGTWPFSSRLRRPGRQSPGSRCRRPALRSEREVMRSPTAVRKVRRLVERRSTDKRPGQVPDHRRRDANSADRFPNG
jgi:hypothetical protein